MGPLSPNTSGQMSMRLTKLIRQGAGRGSAALTPQVLRGKAQLGKKISKSQGTRQGGLWSSSPVPVWLGDTGDELGRAPISLVTLCIWRWVIIAPSLNTKKAAQVIGTNGQHAFGVASRASGTSVGKSAKPFGKQPGGNPKLERGFKLERFTAVHPLKILLHD